MTGYHIDLSSRLQTDDSGRDVLRQDIETVVGLATRARQDGLLALEDEIDGLKPVFLRLGVRLVVDGTDPDVITKTLEVALRAGGFEGTELVRRMLLLDGVLGIQAGANPTQLATMLSAYLGEEAADAAAE